MFKEVWLNIGIETTDTHKDVTIKALLDSGATEIFMDICNLGRTEVILEIP